VQNYKYIAAIDNLINPIVQLNDCFLSFFKNHQFDGELFPALRLYLFGDYFLRVGVPTNPFPWRVTHFPHGG